MRRTLHQAIQVSSASGTDNIYISDVIGNRNDSHDDDTLFGREHKWNDHTHSVSLYYPSLAANVTLTAGATAFSLGTITTIIPSSAITNEFDIHFVYVTNASVAGNFMIRLYQGSSGAETQIAEMKVSLGIVLNNVAPVPTMTPLLISNTRVSAAVATSTSGAASIDIALNYHTY